MKPPPERPGKTPGDARLRRRAATPVSDLVAELLDPILARKAGMTTGLIAAWPEIAGVRLQSVCRPEKLLWPPRRGPDDPFEPAALVIACEGASVLRLQHQTGEMLARVNAFFGYHAVSRIKIVQKAVSAPPPRRKPILRELTGSDADKVRAMVERIEDPGLRAALEAFGHSVLQRRRPAGSRPGGTPADGAGTVGKATKIP